MPRNRQALRIVWLAALLAALFALFVRLIPWRAELAETNFQANLIRLESFLFDPPPHAVVVGSSFTGRLLPDYFQSTPLAPVANLGLDGSSPTFGLALTLRRPPPIVLVEENTLLLPWDANDDLLSAATNSVQFRLSRSFPMLRARSRPSSVLYSWLKLRRRGTEGAPSESLQFQPQTDVSRDTGAAAAKPTPPTPAGDVLRAEMKELLARGSRIVLFRLPAGPPSLVEDNAAYGLGEQLAREFHLKELNLVAECYRRREVPVYTDGMHLTPGSARQLSRLLAQLLAESDLTAKRGDP